MSDNFKIFSGSTGKDFAEKVCSYIGTELGKSTARTFSEGNTFVRIEEPVRGQDVYLIQSIGLDPNNEFVEILFWLDAFKRASANSVTAIIPYFGYAKGDKKDEPRVSIRARVCAECLELAGADRIVTMDLHSPQVQGFFKRPVDNLQGMPLHCEYIKSLNLDNYVIVSPDAGFAKQARAYSSYLGVPTVIGDKTRSDHSENAKILELIGDVQGKDAVIVDDFTISGGTLADLADMLKNHGARRIFACISHILLNSRGLEKINQSSIEQVIATDTISNPILPGSDKIHIISAAPLFADSLIRIHTRQSISPLFDNLPKKVIESSLNSI
ncbi:MAG: ribose-phosphate pyrophosphokinae [Eubacterium sp.]|jgi:ribose-phosphate pyrophosphokinase|nr:ribose-phosphate pyrophosphokinae [Eubacterium sp.]